MPRRLVARGPRARGGPATRMRSRRARCVALRGATVTADRGRRGRDTARVSTAILLDCDPGHDDAIALLLALASPELELLGVTTVAGNQTVEKTTANAIRVLEPVGSDVPVAAGAGPPLVREPYGAAYAPGGRAPDGRARGAAAQERAHRERRRRPARLLQRLSQAGLRLRGLADPRRGRGRRGDPARPARVAGAQRRDRPRIGALPRKDGRRRLEA